MQFYLLEITHTSLVTYVTPIRNTHKDSQQHSNPTDRFGIIGLGPVQLEYRTELSNHRVERHQTGSDCSECGLPFKKNPINHPSSKARFIFIVLCLSQFTTKCKTLDHFKSSLQLVRCYGFHDKPTYPSPRSHLCVLPWFDYQARVYRGLEHQIISLPLI